MVRLTLRSLRRGFGAAWKFPRTGLGAMASPFQSPVHTHPCELPLCRRSVNGGLPPNVYLHDVVERDAILAPVVELRGSRRRMCRHLPGLLQRAAVLEVGGDAGAAERVVADFGGDAGGLGAPAHHSPSVGAVEPLAIELRLPTAVGANLDGPEEGDPPSIREPGTLYIFGQVAVERVMTGRPRLGRRPRRCGRR